jgi:RNA polymerase sigma-70 factor (ECF subfamily)
MRMENHTSKSREFLNRDALIEIYEQYSPKLFRYGYRLLGDQSTAEECVADTFSRFLTSLKSNPVGPDNVQAYLYRIAHNWITDYYRRQPPISDTLSEDILDRKNGNPHTLIGEQMETERVRQALLNLPQEQRQVIVLRFLEEQSHEQVAVAMEKSPQATRAIQYRAIASLRRMLLEPEEV